MTWSSEFGPLSRTCPKCGSPKGERCRSIKTRRVTDTHASRWDDQPCADHTPAPSGYTEFMEWAEKMGETHKQERCRGCGLWKIWVPKEVTA